VLAVMTGLLAGSYPAFYLSVFNPLDVIKGKFVNSVSATTLLTVVFSPKSYKK